MERIKTLSYGKLLIGLFLSVMLPGKKVKAQEDLSLGVKIGYLNFTPWTFSGNFDQLTTLNRRSFMLGFQVNKELNPHYFVKTELNFTQFSPVYAFSDGDIYLSQITGSNNPLVQITPSFNRRISIVQSKFGLHIGLGLGLQHNFAKGFTFENDKSFQISGVNSTDPDGNPIFIPTIDLTLTGFEAKGPAIAVYARPEIGFFYHLGDKGKLNLDFQYGVPLNGSIITRTYTEILFEGDTFSSKHVLPGNFYAIMIGYSLNLSQGKK